MSIAELVKPKIVSLIIGGMSPERSVTITEENKAESRRLKAIWEKEKEAKGFTQGSFGADFNIGTQAAVGFFLNGKSAISMKAAKGFAAGLGCSIEDFSPRLAQQAAEAGALASSDGVPARQLLAQAANSSNVELMTFSLVPVVSWVQAGAWCGTLDGIRPGDAESWLPCPIRHSPNTYALVVRGVSMFDPTGAHSFKDGDTIFVDPDRDADHRSLVIARLEDEHESTFKQLIIEGGQRMLQALNPSWPNRIIPINGHCSICGVVIGKVESFIG